MYVQTAQAVPSKFDYAALAVCRGLDRQVTNNVIAISSLQRKTAGETLFSEGDPADSVYEVVRGTVRLCKLLPDGRRQVTGFAAAGDLLGLAPEGSWVYTAEAITDVTLCRYRRTGFDRMIDNVPGFARRLLAVSSHELRAAQDQMLLLGRKTAAERVASFLLLQAARAPDAAEIALPMSRTDIADYLGLTIETVSRALSKMKRDGLIALPSLSSAVIRDRDAVELLAAGDAEL